MNFLGLQQYNVKKKDGIYQNSFWSNFQQKYTLPTNPSAASTLALWWV